MWYVPTSPRRPSSASVSGFLPADRGSSGKNDERADDDVLRCFLFSIMTYEIVRSFFILPSDIVLLIHYLMLLLYRLYLKR